MEQLSDREQIMDCARLLAEHKGEQTIALYVGAVCSFTDYIVITTANSSGHARGLQNHLQQFLHERGLTPLNGYKRHEESSWNLVDLGFAVVHIMSREAREFYELENLWFSGDEVFRSPAG
ncbi:MAG: ribosome silencing factor [Spirochaetaceae bacterium]|nr:MAG: ribosome silencing factor [Spirochaetaceae bacterium]